MSRARRMIAGSFGWMAAWVVGVAVLAAPANAEFGISAFDGEVLTESGAAASQAGGHPFTGSTGFSLNLGAPDPVFGFPMPDGQLRQATVELPPGLVGNPTVVAQCPAQQIARSSRYCPADSQIGSIVIDSPTLPNTKFPLYNLVPSPGVAATFGFSYVDALPVVMHAKVRTGGDYGITIDGRDISQALPIRSVEVELWGTPADPAHDPNRNPNATDTVTLPQRAFLTNPTACPPDGVGLEVRLLARSWDGGSDSASFVSHDVAPNEDVALGPKGCNQVPFDPTVDFDATASGADAPSGLSVNIAFPQDHIGDVNRIATAHLKRAEVTLPEGMSINPASAHGLQGCSDEQLGFDDAEPVNCPTGSRIGSVSATSPLLGSYDANGKLMTDQDGDTILAPLEGGVFVRSQASDDPASGEMFRIALVLENKDRGVLVKLGGQVRVDPVAGRIVTVFDNNPQLPVSEIQLDLKSGPQAPLALPQQCGSHEIVTRLSSWARPDQPVTLIDSFIVDCPGTTGFAPGFEAGSVNPIGGEFSPFVALIERPEGHQYVSGVRVEMPQGLLAKLAGVERCSDAVAGDGTPGVCPDGSRIGTATVAAGSGNPFSLQGPVYLTDPYQGAPYGLSVQVHVKAGPFDLGMVKVRQALHVDRTTAKVSVVSDALPQIVKGVPVRLRSVDVDVDRTGFTVNPTSCGVKQIDATLTSIDGAVHKTSSRFQAGDCQALPFKPRLSMALTGKRQRTTGRHPGVKAVVRQAGVGEAGIERAKVTLPKSIALDPENAQALCEFADGTRPDLENHCPKGSIVGRARAKTPLLDRDLVGNVYFVKNVERHPKTGALIRKLPMIVVALRGQIAINLTGKSDSAKDGRLINTFATVPDAPISQFNLNIKGGKTGILAVTRTRNAKINLCAKPKSHIANNEMDGHNGKRADYRVRVKTPCGKAKAKQGKRSKKR